MACLVPKSRFLKSALFFPFICVGWILFAVSDLTSISVLFENLFDFEWNRSLIRKSMPLLLVIPLFALEFIEDCGARIGSAL